jgi:hypothetical protein
MIKLFLLLVIVFLVAHEGGSDGDRVGHDPPKFI